MVASWGNRGDCGGEGNRRGKRRGGVVGEGRSWYCLSSLIHREGPGPTAAPTRPTAPVTTLSLLLFLSILSLSLSLFSLPILTSPSRSSSVSLACDVNLTPPRPFLPSPEPAVLPMQVWRSKCWPGTPPLAPLRRCDRCSRFHFFVSTLRWHFSVIGKEGPCWLNRSSGFFFFFVSFFLSFFFTYHIPRLPLFNLSLSSSSSSSTSS